MSAATKRVVGSCSQCGLCCKTLALPVPDKTAWRRVNRESVFVARQKEITPAMRQFLAARGVTICVNLLIVPVDPLDPEPVKIGRYNNQLVAYVRSRCKQLASDNRCKIHGTSRLPSVCRKYPTVDDDLSIVEGCTFQIEDI